VRSSAEREAVAELIAAGMNDCQIERDLGIPRARAHPLRWLTSPQPHQASEAHPRVRAIRVLDRSDDIKRIFCDACDALGVPWRVMNRDSISVARRASVARLDEFVGPKR
jgi:hypothetical protein